MPLGLIFFNDPIKLDNPAANAVRMALAMQKSFVPLRVEWKKRGYDLDLGIEDSVQAEPLGDVMLKGIAYPVPAFNVTRSRTW